MVVLICISLMMLSIFSSACLPSVFLFGRMSIQILCQFFKLVNVLFLFLMLNCISSLCILDTQSLIKFGYNIPYQIDHLQICSPFSRRSSHFVNSFLLCASLIQFHLFIFVFPPCLRRLTKKNITKTKVRECSMFSSKSFIIWVLILSLIHFKLIFVHGIENSPG